MDKTVSKTVSRTISVCVSVGASPWVALGPLRCSLSRIQQCLRLECERMKRGNEGRDERSVKP